MLPIRNLKSNGLFKLLSCNSLTNVGNRHLMQQIHARCQRNIGYFMFHPEKCFNKNNDLKTNYTSIASFNSGSGAGYSPNQELTAVQFEKVSNETLESLTDYFDELIERAAHLPDADVSYGDGVLTVKFGDPYGTYVINRQTPNKQIWLSSPKSGPKRYDFMDGRWIYKHDGKTLHELLNNEIPAIIRDQACFDKCSYSGKEKEAVLNSL